MGSPELAKSTSRDFLTHTTSHTSTIEGHTSQTNGNGSIGNGFATTNGRSQLTANLLRDRFGHDVHKGAKSFSGDSLSVDHRMNSDSSALSSGQSSPMREDALPSEKATKSARHVLRRRKRLFPTVDYESRVSHFDPSSSYSDFRGFFTLFWIGLFIMVLTTALQNLRDTGTLLRTSIFSLLTFDLRRLAMLDFAMVASTAVSLPMQWGYQKGWLRWENSGYLLQHLWQAVWLGGWVYLPFYLDWQWTHQVFFTLHSLTLLMKMHSYSFYCGHLSTTERQLRALDKTKENLESKDQTELRESLAFELTSPSGEVTYPANLTAWNYVDYLLCPTLCYEMSYPRTEKIRYSKVLEKASAIFGCVFLLTLISEEYIYPVMQDAATKLQAVEDLSSTGLILLESISLLLFPFMITFLLVFLVIFEYVLGAFAEITRFADRHFYSDWWNSTNWLEFSREWNIPVHRFLQRHVYLTSRNRIGKPLALVITFLVSAAAHELVMFCITKKVRGYGFFAQMMQLPLFAVQNLPWFRRLKTFNNIMFWCSMIWGLAMISTLYVLM